MAVLINKDSGLAEEVSNDKAGQALKTGTHELPIVDPDGNVGSAPHADAMQMLGDGYSKPSDEQLQGLLKKAKYSGTGQEVLTGLEGAGEGASFGLSAGAERMLGVDPEDIRGRAETNPISHMVGQGVGLVGSSLAGVGEGAALEKIGQVGAEALGLGAGKTVIAKVGSMAAKGAIENAVYQSGDELTKAMLSDPDQTAHSAIANVGLAGLIGVGVGGAIGSVSPLWESTLGPKADVFLRKLQSRANGETLPISQDLKSIVDGLGEAGQSIPPEIRAGLSDDPALQAKFQQLRESGSSTGDALRETIKGFQGQVGDQLAGKFGANEGSLSAFEAGESAKNAILEKANSISDSISDKYSEINPQLESIQIPDAARKKFFDKLYEDGTNFGSQGSANQELFRHYAQRAAAQNTIAEVKKLVTEIGSDFSVAKRAGDFEKARALGEIRSSIKEFQDNQVIGAGKTLEAQGVKGAADLSTSLLQDKRAADKAYGAFMDHIGDIASVGKLGKVKSMGQLSEALEKVPSAKLAEKFFDPKNVEGLNFLKKEFPDVLDSLVKAKKSSMLESATKAGDLQHNQLFNSYNKLPKEVRDLMFSKEDQGMIEASTGILRKTNIRSNPSGTAGTLDKLWSHLPAGVGGIASMLTGHGALSGILLGEASKFLGRDLPDAAGLSLLKFLGSTEHVDAGAWKAAADFALNVQKGQAKIGNAAKAVFNADKEVLPISLLPNEHSREKLEKKLVALNEDNTPLLGAGGKIGHYMPEHAAVIGSTAANAVNYLQSLKPDTTPKLPLDPKREPTAEEQHAYYTALDIAAQPLMVLDSIKKGTLLPEEIGHLNKLYPGLMPKYQQEIMHHMVDAMKKETPISYKTKVSLSMFMGQPLDSSMTPQSIQAAQSINAPVMQQQAQNQMSVHQAHSMKNIGKMAQGYATGPQAREMQKAGVKG